MKKILALILLAVMMVTLCACGPDDDPAPFDKAKAISPDFVPAKMPDGPAGFEAERVHTGNCKEADKLLDFAYEALANLGLTANVESIYSISMGLAANDFCFDPHMIDTDDDEIDKDPVIMIVLETEDGFRVLVDQFRLSSAGSDPQDYVCKLFDACGAKVIGDLGFDAEDIIVRFVPQELKGLSFKPVSSEYRELYEDLNTRYFNVMFGCWYAKADGETLLVNGIYYDRVFDKDTDINCMDDLGTYLRKAFTPDMADYILDSVDPYIYQEANGHLYYSGIGIGSSIDIEDIYPKYVAVAGDELYMIVEMVRLDVDDNWEFTGGKKYYEYLFIFDQTVDGWRCRRYRDLMYGFI